MRVVERRLREVAWRWSKCGAGRRGGGEANVGLLSPLAAPLRVGPINVDAQTDGRFAPILRLSLQDVHSPPPRALAAPYLRRDLFWKHGRSLVEPA